jgi:hypothetical protein
VLVDHRARNKPNNPPSAEQLLRIAKDQLGVDEEEDKEDKLDEAGSDNEAEDEGEDVPTRKRATRNSKSDGTVKPTTVKYYNGTAWKPALIRAKLAFRRYTMLECLFPLTDTHLEDAELILSKTVTDMKNKVTFDSGEPLLPIGNELSAFILHRFCSN